MDPSLQPLLACLDQLADQFDFVRAGAHNGLGADFDPELELTRACKMLEHVLREVYGRRLRTPPAQFPTRYTKLEEMRRKHGSLADKIAPYFFQSDPLADEADAQLTQLRPPGRGRRIFEGALAHGIEAAPHAPPALRCLFAQLEDVPAWLDWDLLDVGCRTHQRCGAIGGIVLATACLPLAYRSEAGNKALVLTGGMTKRAARRMSETNRFFIESFTPGSLRPYAAGWKTTVQVRMMHSAMRRWLRQQQKQPWKVEEWGVPINQVDMAATGLLFSVGLLRSLRKVGFFFSAAETEGVMHLWRYAGYLVGIAPDLLRTTETQGTNLFSLLMDLWGTADEHSVELTHVLMKSAMPVLVEASAPWLPGVLGLKNEQCLRELLGRFCFGLSSGLIGRALADELKYPSTHWRVTAPLLLSLVIRPLELCRRIIPGGTRLAAHLGFRQIQRMMANKAFARPVSYRGPNLTLTANEMAPAHAADPASSRGESHEP